MAKISITLGMTLKMATGGGYNFFRPELSISDIETQDADGNYNAEGVDHQVKTALQGIHYTYSEAEQAMIQIVETSEVTDKSEIVTEIQKKLSNLEDSLEKHIENSSVTETSDSTIESESTVDTTDSSDDEEDDDGDW